MEETVEVSTFKTMLLAALVVPAALAADGSPAGKEEESSESATLDGEEKSGEPSEAAEVHGEQEDGGGGKGAVDKKAFASWLDSFKSQASASGISNDTVASLDTVSLLSRVIELDRHQPETRLTLAQYLARVVPDSRVERGRRLYEEHRDMLAEIEEEYGVPPRFLVALWGIETDYGRNTGGFRVLDALATLAFDGRRSSFFRQELLNALRIIDDGHITADGMKGSWAGALGQCQFMPSSFLSYAVDYTGDGKRDIWSSLPDVFASSANYLVQHGWQTGQTWGRRVRLPADFDSSLIGLEIEKHLDEWQELGVRRACGSDLPTASFKGSLVQPGGAGGPTFLVYENYRTVLRWNRSLYFATAVGLLADRIAAR